MRRIEVEINPLDYQGPYSDACFEAWCIGKLKNAGIPINGVLVFKGIKEGVLARCDNPESRNMRFIWRKDNQTLELTGEGRTTSDMPE